MRVRLYDHLLPLIPLHHLEGAGAHRVAAVIFVVGVLRNQGQPRDGVDEERVRLFKMKNDFMGVRGFNAIDVP